MSSLKAGLGLLAPTLIVALALASLAAVGNASAASSQKLAAYSAPQFASALAKTTSKRKEVRSCNKGDNRKGHSSAVVNAWAVACEFPPRSQLLPTSALNSVAASAIAALGG